MQLGNVGIGHDESSHHITSSFHHHHENEMTKGASASVKASVSVSPRPSASQQDNFSLSAWIADPFKTVKNLFGKVWNGEDAGNAAKGIRGRALSGQEQGLTHGAQTAAAANKAAHGAQTVAAAKEMTHGAQAVVAANETAHSTQTAAAANETAHSTQTVAVAEVMPTQQTVAAENPYFQPVADVESKRPSLVQKVRERAQKAAEFLAKRFSSSRENSFQTKRERPKEDLRKRSHYRGDKLEIDCVLTDDSYLLDSYDRNGQYSQLSAKK
ncbi:MAG: hypothetical protein NC417_00445 [Candidatus Gastranaerophilales bacterium]|nr:hypothetical protein [Candidatus Gastranaerophilales bacterium]